eukprot:TRINITY_DN18753_c0_g1_i1.p1 TRINITY_DN18753_c0_g1~~TRINITY_DN18753_c0_g1_i1.p1  ORF type:complete len:316 (+),score=61.45 TRINITY_DN18753_c0_g1_i1:205-1152(+)
MHLSEAFSLNSAIAGLVGGIGIGVVAAVKLWGSRELMPSATPHPWSTSGFVATGLLASRLFPSAFESSIDLLSTLRVAAGGAMVGFGAGLGEGCTSGNGIQGLAARSKASLVFVCTFMAAGAISASVTQTSEQLDFASPPLSPSPSLRNLSPLLVAWAASGAVQLVFAKLNDAVASFAAGAAFACCLTIGGMVRSTRVIGFLDIMSDQGWDPTLAFVMAGGLAVTLPVYHWLGLLQNSHPSVQAWAKRPVDWQLVLAGMSFGVGWGCTGLCPGPALVVSGTGSSSALLFLAAMFGARHVGQAIRNAAASPSEKQE